MKKILVPTDLTVLGDYAYTIASKIAESNDAQIILLSVVMAPQNTLFDANGNFIEDGESDYTVLKQKQVLLQEQLDKFAENKKQISKQISVIGNINQAILNCTKNEEIDLIVMGTNGNYSQTLFSHQSHAEFLINHSSIPIITLKCDRSNLNVDKIAFVSDFLEPENYQLDTLKKVQSIFDSTLILLKILTKRQIRPKEEIIKTIENFAEKNELNKYEIHFYEDQSVEHGVSKFCAEKDIDLIALGTHQRSGFSKFFRHSITDDIVNNVFHPILTFPIKET